MAETNDITLIAPVIERVVYCKPLRGEYAKEVYKETRAIAAKDFKNASAFYGYWQFNEQTGEINGSSTFWDLLADKVLRKSGLWIPGLPEARILEARGKLTNGVYRDFGMVIYDSQDPNTEVASPLVSEAQRRRLALPLILPFRALDIKKSQSRYGAKILLEKDAEGIISGEQAVEALKNFNYKANAGARGLYRYYNGDWDADDDDLVSSSFDAGRVDFVCGVATQKNLEGIALQNLDSLAKEELKRIETRIQKAQATYSNALKA